MSEGQLPPKKVRAMSGNVTEKGYRSHESSKRQSRESSMPCGSVPEIAGATRGILQNSLVSITRS